MGFPAYLQRLEYFYVHNAPCFYASTWYDRLGISQCLKIDQPQWIEKRPRNVGEQTGS